jgi:hypothetical protein
VIFPELDDTAGNLRIVKVPADKLTQTSHGKSKEDFVDEGGWFGRSFAAHGTALKRRAGIDCVQTSHSPKVPRSMG